MRCAIVRLSSTGCVSAAHLADRTAGRCTPRLLQSGWHWPSSTFVDANESSMGLCESISSADLCLGNSRDRVVFWFVVRSIVKRTGWPLRPLIVRYIHVRSKGLASPMCIIDAIYAAFLITMLLILYDKNLTGRDLGTGSAYSAEEPICHSGRSPVQNSNFGTTKAQDWLVIRVTNRADASTCVSGPHVVMRHLRHAVEASGIPAAGVSRDLSLMTMTIGYMLYLSKQSYRGCVRDQVQ
jgi:hypothetical protein